MKTTSINQTVMAACIGLMILFAASVGAGIWVAVDLAGELRETSLSSKILQTHQQADMGHDALRADVLLAFQTQTPGSVNKIADVRKDLAEHAADFNNAIDTNLKLAKNPEIRTALTEVAAPLADYVAAAQSIVAKVDTQPEAAANDMGPFMEKFLVLEEAMAKVSERIEALSKGMSNMPPNGPCSLKS